MFELDTSDSDSNDSHRKKNVIDTVNSAYKIIHSLKIQAKGREDNERHILLDEADRIFKECLKTVSKYIVNDHVLHLLLKEIDDDSDKLISGAKTFLFACLIYEKSRRLISRIIVYEDYMPEDLVYYPEVADTREMFAVNYLYNRPFVYVHWQKQEPEDE